MIVVERGSTSHRLLVGAAAGVPLLAAVLLPTVTRQIQLHRFTTALTFGIVLVGLSYVVGQVGVLSLAQGAFMGMGAFAAAHAVLAWHWPNLVAPVASAVFGFGVGLALGAVALRVPRFHLALLTLAVAVSFPILLRRYGGPLGTVVPGTVTAPSWTGLDPQQKETWQYYVVLVGVIAAYVIVRNLTRGGFGRRVTAMREDPVAATAFGIDVQRTAMLTFAAGCAVAAWGGGLSVLDSPFVAWNQYPFRLGIELFAIVMIMGRGRLLAALAGGFLYVFGPVVLSDRGFVGNETIIYAVFLIAVVIVFRGRGLGDAVDRLRRRLVRIVEPEEAGAASDLDPPPDPGPVDELVLLDPDDRRGTWHSTVRD